MSYRHATERLFKDITPAEGFHKFSQDRDSLEEGYCAQDYTVPECKESQKHWSIPIFEREWKKPVDLAPTQSHKARLMATATKGASSWLHAVPAAATGTLLDDESMRIATGLRLGTLLVAEHTCGCGATVATSGTHGLSRYFGKALKALCPQ